MVYLLKMVIFHGYVSHNQRVNPINIPLNPYKIPLNPYKIPLNPYKIPLNHYKIPLNPYKITINPYKIPSCQKRPASCTASRSPICSSCPQTCGSTAATAESHRRIATLAGNPSGEMGICWENRWEIMVLSMVSPCFSPWHMKFSGRSVGFPTDPLRMCGMYAKHMWKQWKHYIFPTAMSH